MPDKKPYDLIVVGGGPAGIGAAVQAGIYGMRALVIERDRVGGRLRLARRVDNFPGTASGSSPAGPALGVRLGRWLAGRRIPVRKGMVEGVGFRSGLFRAKMASGGILASRAVIVATGVMPKAWPAPGGRCDRKRIFGDWREVPVKHGECVAVIGGGEAAFDQACSLAERGAEVILLMRGARPRAYPGLAAEASRLGVNVVRNMPVRKVSCDGRGAVLWGGYGRRFCCDYVLPAVGHRPQLPAIARPALARKGRGLWLAGDVREPRCRQAAVAYGDGVRCAMLAWEYLRREGL